MPHYERLCVSRVMKGRAQVMGKYAKEEEKRVQKTTLLFFF